MSSLSSSANNTRIAAVRRANAHRTPAPSPVRAIIVSPAILFLPLCVANQAPGVTLPVTLNPEDDPPAHIGRVSTAARADGASIWWREGDREVDFVLSSPSGTVAIEIALSELASALSS